MRQLSSRIVALLLGLTTATAACEAALRIFAPQPLGLSCWTSEGMTLHIPNAHVRYRRTEFDNVIDINSMGLREREIERDKPAGLFRILVLGDSFAEGKQVAFEETFPKRLESLLRQQFPDRRFEVVNGGVSGYGTADEIKFFELLGRSLAPDLVILAFCIGNDVENNRDSRFFTWDGARLEEIPVPAPPRWQLALERLREYGASHSHLYQFLRDRYHRTVASGRSEANEEEPASIPSPAASEDDWRRTEALIDRLGRMVSDTGAPLFIVAIPKRAQVFDVGSGSLDAAGSWNGSRDEVQRRLASYARRRALPFLDLLPALRAASVAERTYYRIDGHFNAHGHAVAADEIWRALEKNGLLRDRAPSSAS